MSTDAFTHIVPKTHLSTHMKLPHMNHCLHHIPCIHTHKYLLQKHVGSTYLHTYTNLYTFLMATNLATIKYNPLFPLQSSPPHPTTISATHMHTYPPAHSHPNILNPHMCLFSPSPMFTPSYPCSPQIVPSYTPRLHAAIYTPKLTLNDCPLLYTQPAPPPHTLLTVPPTSTFVART